MTLTVSYVVLTLGIVAVSMVMRLIFMVARADGIESRKSAARVRSFRDAIMGRALIRDDFLPDARVQGGLIYNKKEKRLEVSGRLSSDSLERIYRK